MRHANAPLSELGRLRLARCVVEDGWPVRRAAERFQVSPTTAQRWADRYRAEGRAGIADRSSPCSACPTQPLSSVARPNPMPKVRSAVAPTGTSARPILW